MVRLLCSITKEKYVLFALSQQRLWKKSMLVSSQKQTPQDWIEWSMWNPSNYRMMGYFAQRRPPFMPINALTVYNISLSLTTSKRFALLVSTRKYLLSNSINAWFPKPILLDSVPWSIYIQRLYPSKSRSVLPKNLSGLASVLTVKDKPPFMTTNSRNVLSAHNLPSSSQHNMSACCQKQTLQDSIKWLTLTQQNCLQRVCYALLKRLFLLRRAVLNVVSQLLCLITQRKYVQYVLNKQFLWRKSMDV